MDSRAQFEAWFRSKHEGQMITKGKGYSDPITQLMWQAWQASRAAIEVVQPKFIDSREALSMGRMVDYSNGFGDAMDAYEQRLKVVGISIKGEE
ncbi:hypothetical protein ACFL9S_11045 [Erwinia sp. AnSW2-5]|uniref:hypothetical protein n=1 Tax=Erwinia sp. AnSW2-5 TaxID=3367692 RepID=UPI00385AD5E5